jgi:hypothetical protein
LVLGDVAGEVGDDRPEPAQFAGVVGESEEGGEVHLDVDHSPILVALPALVAAVEEVEEDVGAELVDGAGLVFGFEALGYSVDVAGDGLGSVGRQVVAGEGGGSVWGGFYHHPPPLDCGFVPFFGVVGIGGHGQFGDPGAELAGGQPRSILEGFCCYVPGGLYRQVACPVDDHPGFRHINMTGSKGFPHSRVPLHQAQRHIQLEVGGPSGQRQPGPDLGSGRPIGQLDIIAEHLIHRLGDRRHRPERLSGMMRHHLAVGLQHHHPVVPRQPGHIDPGESVAQLRARCQPVQFLTIEHMFVA